MWLCRRFAQGDGREPAVESRLHRRVAQGDGEAAGHEAVEQRGRPEARREDGALLENQVTALRIPRRSARSAPRIATWCWPIQVGTSDRWRELRHHRFRPGRERGVPGSRRRGHRAVVAHPIVTSCALFIQVGWDSVSAGMVRVHRQPLGLADITSHWVWCVGAGSAAIMVTSIVESFSWLRLETSVAQTDTRTFVITQKV